jgi:predicted secreted protein
MKAMQAVQKSSGGPAPYSPSWFDRFSDWVESLPGPAWIAYLLLGLLSCAALVLIQAGQGAYPDGRIDPWHFFLALQPAFFLGLMHYLDRAAGAALQRFWPAIDEDQASYASWLYRLTTLPARAARRAILGGELAFLVLLGPTVFQIELSPFHISFDSASLQAFGMSTTVVSQRFVLLFYLILWAVIGVLVLHTAHQLNQIRDLYNGVVSIDPYQPEPLYAFSTVTSLTAVMLLLNSYGWVWALLRGAGEGMASFQLSGPISVNIFFAGLSVFLFIWPMWGAHHLLDTSKKESLRGNAGHFKAVVSRLHGAIESGQMAGTDDWQKVMGALELERARLERLPTWPWHPEASRGLLAALVVPLVVWLLQFGLGKLLG